MRPCYVYILYSDSLNKYYKGHSFNVIRRLNQHNAGTSSYTKSGIPWTLVLSLKKKNKIEALELERKLKNLNKHRLIEFIDKYKKGHSLWVNNFSEMKGFLVQ
jgi:putative endonuclease